MATVIEALTVLLSLDPADFIKNAKIASEAGRKVKNDAVKDASDIEAANKKSEQSFKKVTSSFLEMLALFTGGKKFGDFIEGAVQANNAMGLLSTSLSQSPELLSAWSIAAKRMGGSAAATQGSLQALSDSLVDLRTQGKALPNELFLLQAQSGKNIDFSHGLERYTLDLATAGKELAKTDPAAASRYVRALVHDPATSALLIQQGANMKNYLEQQKKFAPSEADINAASKMTDAQGKLGAAYDLLAAKLMTALSPALTWLANRLADVLEWIAKWVERNPGWVQAITAVVSVIAGARMLSAIKTVLSLTRALVGLSQVGMGSGMFAALGRLGIWGAAVGAIVATGEDMYEHSSANAGEDERARHERYAKGKGSSDTSAAGKAGDMPANSSAGNLSKLIEEESKRAGIDPRIMEGVRAGESKHAGHYDVGDVNDGGAYGPFQFNMGKGRFGDQFKRDTGLDPRDPRTIPAQTRYMAEFLARQLKRDPNYASGGHGSRLHRVWHGYKGPVNPDPRWGDSGYVPSEVKPNSLMKGIPHAGADSIGGGAQHSAALNSISNDYRASTTSTSNEAHVHGPITIQTAATDANGIAGSMREALRDKMFSQTANFGPA